MLRKSILITILVTVFGSLSSSCTFRGLVYRNLDWLAMRQINQNFNLTREQRREFEPRIRELVNELKGEGLDGIIDILSEVKKVTATGSISDEAFLGIEKKLESLLQTLTARAMEDTAEFLSALEDRQLRHFHERMKERNDWIRKLAEADEKTYPKEIGQALDKSYERYEKWLGDLQNEQKQMIQNYWPRTPAEAKLWYQSRTQQQAKFIEICQSTDQKTLLAALRAWQQDPDWLKKQAGVSREVDSFRDFLFNFRRSFSPDQLQHLNGKVSELIVELRKMRNS